MKISFDCGELLLEGKYFIFHTINNWAQFVRPREWNWIDFHLMLCNIDVELDRSLPGWEVTIALLGLGFRFRWNFDWSTSKHGKIVLERIEEAQKDYDSRRLESGKEEGVSEKSGR